MPVEKALGVDGERGPLTERRLYGARRPVRIALDQDLLPGRGR